MIRKLKSGEYRLYSWKVDPDIQSQAPEPGKVQDRRAAQRHERAVQFFKHG
jgi:hypothetical protein